MKLGFLYKRNDKPDADKFWFSLAATWSLVIGTGAFIAFLEGRTVDWTGLAAFIAAITAIPLYSLNKKRDRETKKEG